MSRLDELIAELCPDGVVYVPLGTVCQIGKGIQFNKSDMSDEGTYPVINGGINPSGYIEQYNQEENTITISQGGASAGYVNWLDVKFWAGAHCYVIKPKTNLLNRYAYHFIKSQEYKLQECQYGAGIPALAKSTVEALNIPVPPIEVQREIVLILDNFTELTAELIASLDSELQSRKKQYQEYSRILFNGMENIRTTTLGEIVDIQMCKRIKKDQTSSTGDVPFYQNGTLGGTAKLYITNELFDEFSQKYKYPIKGEVMLSTVGTVGKAIQFDGSKSYFQDSNIVWLRRKNDEVTDEYLFWFCVSMPWKLPERATLKHLHNYMIADTEIVIPSLESQKYIVSKFQDLQRYSTNVINALQQEIEARQKQYEYYRDKLLTFKQLA